MIKSKMLLLLVISVLFFVTPVFSQTTVDHAESTINIAVDVLALFFLAFAFLASWSVYTNYREGQLSTPWALIMGGVCFFFFGRVLQAGHNADFFVLTPIIESFINLFVSLALLLGMVLYKKTIT